MNSKKGRLRRTTSAKLAGSKLKGERQYEIGYLPAGKESYEYDDYENLRQNYERLEVSESNLLMTIHNILIQPGVRLEYVVLQDR